jgi:hypothetical protein
MNEMKCPKCGNDLKEYVTRFRCRNPECQYEYKKYFQAGTENPMPQTEPMSNSERRRRLYLMKEHDRLILEQAAERVVDWSHEKYPEEMKNRTIEEIVAYVDDGIRKAVLATLNEK